MSEEIEKQYETILKIFEQLDNKELKVLIEQFIETIRILLEPLIDAVNPIIKMFNKLYELFPEDLKELMEELKEFEDNDRAD